MARLLLVEDDPAQLLLARTVLQRALPTHVFVTAQNGAKALEVLATESIDLVLLDLVMPEMDGLSLMGWMSRHAPNVPVIVLSASDLVAGLSVGPDTQLAGALRKPVPAPVLVAAVTECLATHARGELRGFGLHSFLQLVELERKTCLIEVEGDGRRGWLSFLGGELVAAGAGSQIGEPAVVAILEWEHPVIRLRPRSDAPARTVNHPLSYLMLEAARLADESGRDEEPPQTLPAASWCTPEDLTRLVPDARVAIAFDDAGRLEAQTGALGPAKEAAEAAASLLAALTELGGEGRPPGLSILHGQPTAVFLMRSRRRADGAVALVQGGAAVPIGALLRRLETEEI